MILFYLFSPKPALAAYGWLSKDGVIASPDIIMLIRMD